MRARNHTGGVGRGGTWGKWIWRALDPGLDEAGSTPETLWVPIRRPQTLARLCAGLFCAAALAGCPSTPAGPNGELPLNGAGEGVPAGAQGPSARSVLRLERGLVLWFDAHTPADQGHPGKVAFFVARDRRGGLFLESLGFFEPGTSLRLVPHQGALWLFPMGDGRVSAAAQIYHPVQTLGREVELEVAGRKRRARLLAHEDQGVELRLWFLEREGLYKLELEIGGREVLRLERSGKARWGSRPAPYPASDPVAAWASVEQALLRLDVIGLRQLMTPKLWSRLLPPGEGLTFADGPVDGRRRLELIRQVVPQLLEVELTRLGEFEIQAGQAQAPALLRTRIEGEFNEAPARLDLVSGKASGEARWTWAGFRPLPAPGTEGPDEEPLPGSEEEPELEPGSEKSPQPGSKPGLEPPAKLTPDSGSDRAPDGGSKSGRREVPGDPERAAGPSSPGRSGVTPSKTPRAG